MWTVNLGERALAWSIAERILLVRRGDIETKDFARIVDGLTPRVRRVKAQQLLKNRPV